MFQKAAGAREKAANRDVVDRGQVSRQGSGLGGSSWGARAHLPWAGTMPPQCTAASWKRQPGSPEVSCGMAGWWVGFVLETWVRLLVF